jgi:hypothetical protein
MQRAQRVTATKDISKQMEGVSAKLGRDGLSRKDRLALLRQQAQLGDLRDALELRARRAAARDAAAV